MGGMINHWQCLWYHGTSVTALAGLETNGLLPRGELLRQGIPLAHPLFGPAEGVFLTSEADMAVHWARFRDAGVILCVLPVEEPQPDPVLFLHPEGVTHWVTLGPIPPTRIRIHVPNSGCPPITTWRDLPASAYLPSWLDDADRPRAAQFETTNPNRIGRPQGPIDRRPNVS